MANYVAAARSNTFKVGDPAELQNALPDGVTVYPGNEPGTVYVVADDCDDGAWPTHDYDEQTDEARDVDVAAIIAEHLLDGEIAVLKESGHEKLRYVGGHAVAIRRDGERVAISLDDIYDVARRKLGERARVA